MQANLSCTPDPEASTGEQTEVITIGLVHCIACSQLHGSCLTCIA